MIQKGMNLKPVNRAVNTKAKDPLNHIVSEVPDIIKEESRHESKVIVIQK